MPRLALGPPPLIIKSLIHPLKGAPPVNPPPIETGEELFLYPTKSSVFI